MPDAGSTPMRDPLAYFLTWTTYGTWLPGDQRGWVKEGEGFQVPDWKAEHEARRKLAEEPFHLTAAQREVVEATIVRHCEIRGWHLFAKACRTNTRTCGRSCPRGAGHRPGTVQGLVYAQVARAGASRWRSPPFGARARVDRRGQQAALVR